MELTNRNPNLTPEPTLEELIEFTNKINAEGTITVEKRQAWDLGLAYSTLYEMIKNNASFSEDTIKSFHAIITKNSPNLPQKYKGKYSYSRKVLVGSKWECKPFAPAETIDARMHKLAERYAEFMKYKPEDPTQIYKVVNNACDIMVDLIDIHPFSDGNGRTSRLLADGILISGGLYPMPHWLNPEIKNLSKAKQQFGMMMEYACRGDYRMLLHFMVKQQRAAIESEFEEIEKDPQALEYEAGPSYIEEKVLIYDTLTEYQIILGNNLVKNPPERLKLKLEEGQSISLG